jgi:hypothetical protein
MADAPTLAPKVLCASVKSKKNPHLQCTSAVTESGSKWCSRHRRSQITWTSKAPRPPSFTKRQKTAGAVLTTWWRVYGRLHLRRQHGPAFFVPETSHNQKDVYTFDSITTIPLAYHFSYADERKLIWVFDVRFLSQMMMYGKEHRNPFSQELFPPALIQRLEAHATRLRAKKVPIVYIEKNILTPSQAWNQKVLDVFLKLTSLGYGVNLLWFETMSVRSHETFHRKLYDLWNITAGLTPEDKERIVPGHASGRSPLFRWNPTVLQNQVHELKWWRKQNLSLMNTFVSRATDRTVQSCGALYVLTAFAQTHPKIAEVYPWLV